MTSFWRAGYFADPLRVTLEHQDGSGRFDDPERGRIVLYGASSIRTCIFEVVLPWIAGDDEYVHSSPTELDLEDANDQALAAAIAIDAVRDGLIATRQRRMPQTIYEKAKVRATLEHDARLVDLNSPGVRMQLHDRIAFVAQRLRSLGIDRGQFDKSPLTSQHLDITRAISGFLMRNDFDGERPDGIACDSRHDGINFVFFEGRYVICENNAPIQFTPYDADIVSVAAELGWEP
ncbi:MAG TPA: RES family NAD+ phosphorylase [Candidatus Baltobacteraceae bacterium]